MSDELDAALARATVDTALRRDLARATAALDEIHEIAVNAEHLTTKELTRRIFRVTKRARAAQKRGEG